VCCVLSVYVVCACKGKRWSFSVSLLLVVLVLVSPSVQIPGRAGPTESAATEQVTMMISRFDDTLEVCECV